MSAPAEIARRRTFAIISHPDAGKTTLTEKFLLYGNAVHLAGAVKDRKNQRATRSDWMELERQRGISISSTVLQFEYAGFAVNLLDTPGPQGLLRGHLPGAHRRRRGSDGDRRRQGHRNADAQAVRGLPPPRRAHLHVHEQVRPADAESDRAPRRTGERPRFAGVRRDLAAGQRPFVPRRFRPAAPPGSPVRARARRRLPGSGRRWPVSAIPSCGRNSTSRPTTRPPNSSR